MNLKWWKEVEKRETEISLLRETIGILRDTIKGQQEEIKFLLEKFMGGAAEVVAPDELVPYQDDDALQAGTFIDETKESKDGSD